MAPFYESSEYVSLDESVAQQGSSRTGGGKEATAAASKKGGSVHQHMGHGAGSIAVGLPAGVVGGADTSGRGAYEVADEDGDECDDNGVDYQPC